VSAEKVRADTDFTFKGIRVASRGEGQQKWGTTFPCHEVQSLVVETECVNNHYHRKEWEATVLVGLFLVEGDRGVLLGRVGEKLIVAPGQETFRHEARFTATELEGGVFRPGIYRMQVVINGRTGLSDEIRLEEPATPSTFTAAEREEALAALYQLVGLRGVKEEITRLHERVAFVRLRREHGFDDPYPPLNMIFMGNPGTGKSTVARVLGEIFHRAGVLDNGRLHRCSYPAWSGLEEAAVERLARETIAASTGGVLLVENVEELYPAGASNDTSPRVLMTLLAILEHERPPGLVILAGEQEALRRLTGRMPGMEALFPLQLAFEDYNTDELMEIFSRMLERKQFRLAPGAGKAYRALLENLSASREGTFANGHLVEEHIQEMIDRVAKRLMTRDTGEHCSREEMMLVLPGDVPACAPCEPGADLARFDALILPGGLKSEIRDYVNHVYFLRERQRHGFTGPFAPLNAIFAGNPGTGRLAVAKVFGEVLAAAGVAARPDVLVKERGELVGDGSYPPQQFALYAMEQAKGGILYIRATPGLLQDTPGLTALGTIIGKISGEEGGDPLVILEGDAGSMEGLLATNPLLRQLFPYVFHFEDFRPDELFQIALQAFKERDYALHPKAGERLMALIHKACETSDHPRGNSLFIEKVVEKAIRNLSRRTMESRSGRALTRKELMTLRPADIPDTPDELAGNGKETFDEKEINAALDELEQMVGQQKLKKQVREFVNLARHYNRQGTKLTTHLSLQWCFTGNSGMGKGTVARVIARVYKAMGLIDRIEVSRFKVEKLIGRSEEEIEQQIGMALLQSKGGIFFFDEDSPGLNDVRGFKKQLRAILTRQMAGNPGTWIVIFADQDPPRHLLTEDVERASDMINILPFEDYTTGELMEILKRYLTSEAYRMTRRAQQHVASFIEQLVATKSRNRVSARLIKLVGEMMIRNCIRRLTAKGEAKGEKCPRSITLEDVADFTPGFLKGMTYERKSIGF
jgi:AAA+ superfamily predicted ATPase